MTLPLNKGKAEVVPIEELQKVYFHSKMTLDLSRGALQQQSKPLVVLLDQPPD